MGFDSNEYLVWYVSKLMSEEQPINLHSSGVHALGMDAVTPVIDGNPWYLSEQFAHELARWLKLPQDEVIFTAGATGGTLLCLLGLTEPTPSRELLVEAPVYEPLRAQAQSLGHVKRFARTAQDGWQLPLSAIKGLISERTDVVMITEPTNPGGVSCSRDDVLELADLAHKNGAMLLINEAYRGFTDEPSYHRERENIVVVSSLSKLFGAYAYRLGWVSADADRIDKLKIAHMNLGSPSAPSAAFGLGLMGRADELQAVAQSLARRGIDLVDSWVDSLPGISWSRPSSMGFGALQLPPDQADDVALAEALLRERNVLTIPGTFFDAPGTLRVAWLQSGEQLEEGLTLLADQLRIGY